MKIAIQFSGQLRSFVQPYNYFKKNLLDLTNCDVFLSTWDENDNNLTKFVELYNPIAVRTEKLMPDFFKDLVNLCKNGWTEPVQYVKIDYMVYGFYQKYICNKFRQQYELENNITYDVIIVVRPDLLLAEPFPIYLLSYAKNTLLIPAGSDWENGINDLMAIGNNQYITQYCAVYERLEKYIKKRILVHPEHINKYNLDELNVPLKRFGYTTHLRARRMT